MTDSVVDPAYALRTRRNATAWQAFVVLIAAVTILPMVFVPFSQHVMANADSALGALIVLNFLGNNFHVAASSWFFTDKEMRAHFRQHPRRYIIVPLLLIVGCALLFQFADKPLRSWTLAAFFSWQLWHFQKQNVGVLSFIAAGTGSGPLSVWERRTLAAAAVAGVLGFFSLAKIGLSDWASQLAVVHQLGAVAYLAVPVLFATAVIKTPALAACRLRLAFLALGASFFLPTYLFDDPMSATMGYALAHGLQYVVFMGIVSVRRKAPIASLVTLLGLSVLGALLLNAAVTAPDIADLPYGRAIYGVFVGVVMTHFVLDAGIWRLREPFQRSYIRERFSFVFNR
ncbi:MAG TPA: hypothetical protein VGJ56_01780 [Reyranella sp.]|jgi:hypothetical protein